MARISNQNITKAFINQITTTRNLIDETQKEISSGLRVIDPSDDPSRSAIIADLSNTLTRIERHGQRIAVVKDQLSQQENIINHATEAVLRAKELASQAANENQSVESRAQIAQEVYALRDTLVSLANTQVQGKYIYGGGADDQPPFQLDANQYPTGTGIVTTRYTFQPTPEEAAIQKEARISDTQTLRITSDGDQIFSTAITELEELGRTLSGFTTGYDVLGDPDPLTSLAYNFPNDYQQQTADIRTHLDNIESVRGNEMRVERTNLGSRYARADLADSILTSTKVDTTQSRSTLQDSDIFAATTRLTELQLGLQATLASGVQLNNLSILDFI